MGFINCVIKHDGTDISSETISYDREHQICNGIGTLELFVPLNISRTFKPWDVIEIWENGNKKAKFFIDSVSKNAREGNIKISATDGSKKLSDYFITDSYTIDYLSYGRTWIEKFLDEAGISYTFTVGDNGSVLSNNTALGFDSAFNTITTLLQQSGWYMYFDGSGTAIIGNLNKDVSNPDHTISAADFSVLERELDDDRLRNRAVVWGNSNPTYGEVFVDISVPTPWNYDSDDKRAVVLSNSSIYNNTQALALAQKLLNEFTQIKDEKNIIVVNDYNLKIGEILKVNSKYWAGRGLITGITASMSADGLVYQVNINKKCPRLFTFFSTLPPTISGFYTYIGTLADGIWRKHTRSSVWGDDSYGLEDLKINDLFIRNGVFATVADDGYLYSKTSEFGGWNKYEHPPLNDIEGVTYSNMDLRAKACSINMSDNIVVAYNFVASGVAPPASGIGSVPPSGLSWVLELTGTHSLIKAEQVVISGGAGYGGEFTVYDLESPGEYNVVSVSGYIPISGYNMDAVDDYIMNGTGYRTVSMIDEHFRVPLPPDSKSLSAGWGYGDHGASEATVIQGAAGTSYPSSLICDNDGTTYWYASPDGNIVKIDIEAETSTAWSFTVPTEWSDANPYEVGLMLRHSGGDNFDIVAVIQDSITDANTVYLYSYTLGNSTLTSRGNSAIGGAYDGAGIIGNQCLVGYHLSTTAHAIVVNLVSGSFSDVDVFTGMGAGYKGLNGHVRFFSTGDSLIYTLTWITGTDITTFDNCPLFPADEAKTMEMWTAGWRITEYGGSGLLGPTLLKSVPTYDGSQGEGDSTTHRMEFVISKVFTEEAVTNTLLRKAYMMRFLGIDHSPCLTATYPDWYELWSFGISYPDMTIFYEEQGNNGNYIREDIDYDPPDGGIEWVKKDGISISSVAFFIPYSSKYNLPGYIVYYYEGGNGWRVFRPVPAYGAGFGLHTFTTFDNDDFGYTSDSKVPMDDLTGMLVNNQENNRIPSTSRYDHTTALSKIYSTGSSGWGGITQNFGVTSAYTLIKPKFNIGSDFPLGTILKHTSLEMDETSVAASEDSLEQTLGNFKIVLRTDRPMKVDTAKEVPTVVYDIPLEDGDDSTFGASITNEEDTFYSHADPKPVYCGRTFDLPLPGTFPTFSGTFDPADYDRYIGISNREGILASRFDLSTPWVNMVAVASGVVISGLITQFETSNFVPEGTYFFYTVSGVTSFFQKNPEEDFWRDYSAGLPLSAITIIRVDDLI